MKKPFTLGIVAGIASLAVAVPLVAQIAGAATGSQVSSGTRPALTVPTQTCVEAMADLEDARLANMDAMTALHKTQMQARAQALRNAAAIADSTARQEALQAMRDTMRGQDADQPAAVTAAMEALRTACGDSGMHGGFGPGMMGGGRGMGFGMHEGKGPMNAMMADKLGMTETELQAAIDGGKTPHEIAEEKGIELPMRGGRGGGRGWNAASSTANTNQ